MPSNDRVRQAPRSRQGRESQPMQYESANPYRSDSNLLRVLLRLSTTSEGGCFVRYCPNRATSMAHVHSNPAIIGRIDHAFGPRPMSLVALSELLGASVRDASGTVRGRVREIAVTPQEHPTRVAFLIVRTSAGERVVPARMVRSLGPTVRADSDSAAWDHYVPSDGVLLLKRDLLDQQ